MLFEVLVLLGCPSSNLPCVRLVVYCAKLCLPLGLHRFVCYENGAARIALPQMGFVWHFGEMFGHAPLFVLVVSSRGKKGSSDLFEFQPVRPGRQWYANIHFPKWLIDSSYVVWLACGHLRLAGIVLGPVGQGVVAGVRYGFVGLLAGLV